MFMKHAIEMAELNADNNFAEGGPFGAVIVKAGSIVGRGKNNVLLYKDPTAHAEVCAIRDACKTLDTYDLSGCELYTSCMPCPMCLSAAIWSNIKTIYYGNTKEDAENIGFRDDDIYDELNNVHDGLDLKIISLNQQDRKLTLSTFLKFKELKDKKIY